jgi:anti-sigma-K factor RskA
MSVRRHEAHLLTGSYALDALSEAERAEFERHLARCPSCAEEVRGLRETAARLAMAAAVPPPPGMRGRVLAAAQSARQLGPPGRNPLAMAGQRTGRRPTSRAAITTVIMTLAAAVAFLLVVQVSTSRQLQQAQASNRAITAVLAAPDARIESVPGTTGGTVTAVMSLGRHEAVVTADLPALPSSRVYQLWVMTADGSARSAGLVAGTRSGSAPPLLADGVLPGDRLGITVEPPGGTARPTTTPVVVMPVTA